MARYPTTVEFAFPSRLTAVTTHAVLNSAQRYEFAAIPVTLYGTEVAGRTFRSVQLQLYFHDGGTNRARIITGLRIGVKLGAVAWDDLDLPMSIPRACYAATEPVTRDVTAYFTSNFGGADAQNLQVAIAVAHDVASSIQNITCKVIVTYEVDETAAYLVRTRKTVLDGPPTGPTTSYAEIGGSTNAIPRQDEQDGAVLLMSWLETRSSTGTHLSCGLTYRFDGGADDPRGTLPASGAGTTFMDIDRVDLAINSAHALEAKRSASGGGWYIFTPMCLVYCCTYYYPKPGANDTCVVTRSLPFTWAPMDVPDYGYLPAPPPAEVEIYFEIQEPDPVILQSGFEISFSASNADVEIVFGNSVYAEYFGASAEPGTVGGGAWSRRVDDGSANIQQMTIDGLWSFSGLSRGRNRYRLTISNESYAGVKGLTGILHIVYTCGRAAGGEITHARTTEWKQIALQNDSWYPEGLEGLQDWAEDGNNFVAPTLPTLYAISCYAHVWEGMLFPKRSVVYGDWSDSPAIMDYQVRTYGDERPTGFLRSAVVCADSYDSWGMFRFLLTFARDRIMRWRGDVDTTRLNPETRRWIRFWTQGLHYARPGVTLVIDHHSISYTYADSLFGYTGDGSGITVNIHREDTGEMVDQVVSTVGGAYTSTVYDNTIRYFGRAEQSASRVGSSDAQYPV